MCHASLTWLTYTAKDTIDTRPFTYFGVHIRPVDKNLDDKNYKKELLLPSLVDLLQYFTCLFVI